MKKKTLHEWVKLLRGARKKVRRARWIFFGLVPLFFALLSMRIWRDIAHETFSHWWMGIIVFCITILLVIVQRFTFGREVFCFPDPQRAPIVFYEQAGTTTKKAVESLTIQYDLFFGPECYVKGIDEEHVVFLGRMRALQEGTNLAEYSPQDDYTRRVVLRMKDGAETEWYMVDKPEAKRLWSFFNWVGLRTVEA